MKKSSIKKLGLIDTLGFNVAWYVRNHASSLMKHLKCYCHCKMKVLVRTRKLPERNVLIIVTTYQDQEDPWKEGHFMEDCLKVLNRRILIWSFRVSSRITECLWRRGSLKERFCQVGPRRGVSGHWAGVSEDITPVGAKGAAHIHCHLCQILVTVPSAEPVNHGW